jgi:hypothetical protein
MDGRYRQSRFLVSAHHLPEAQDQSGPAKEEENMSLSQEAERAYGPNFVPKATAVASKLGIPLEWLLAAIYWETTHFKSKGPPWPVNRGDKGGGLIGFTPPRGVQKSG